MQWLNDNHFKNNLNSLIESITTITEDLAEAKKLAIVQANEASVEINDKEIKIIQDIYVRFPLSLCLQSMLKIALKNYYSISNIIMIILKKLQSNELKLNDLQELFLNLINPEVNELIKKRKVIVETIDKIRTSMNRTLEKPNSALDIKKSREDMLEYYNKMLAYNLFVQEQFENKLSIPEKQCLPKRLITSKQNTENKVRQVMLILQTKRNYKVFEEAKIKRQEKYDKIIKEEGAMLKNQQKEKYVWKRTTSYYPGRLAPKNIPQFWQYKNSVNQPQNIQSVVNKNQSLKNIPV